MDVTDHSPFVTALHDDVCGRLPLWTTRYVRLAPSGASAVASTFTDGIGATQRRLFIAAEASDATVVDEAALMEWIALVEDWHSLHTSDPVTCFLCFVDLAGTVSYYECATATEARAT